MGIDSFRNIVKTKITETVADTASIAKEIKTTIQTTLEKNTDTDQKPKRDRIQKKMDECLKDESCIRVLGVYLIKSETKYRVFSENRYPKFIYSVRDINGVEMFLCDIFKLKCAIRKPNEKNFIAEIRGKDKIFSPKATFTITENNIKSHVIGINSTRKLIKSAFEYVYQNSDWILKEFFFPHVVVIESRNAGDIARIKYDLKGATISIFKENSDLSIIIGAMIPLIFRTQVELPPEG